MATLYPMIFDKFSSTWAHVILFSRVMAQTGISKSTLWDLFAEYKRNGHILRTKSTDETRGRKRKLTAANVGVRLPFLKSLQLLILFQIPYRQHLPEE